MDSQLTTVFGPLERWAPGDDGATLDALARLGPLPAHARIVDLGCGQGRSSRLLARATGAHVLAIDQDAAALGRLAADALAEGLPVDTQVGDLDAGHLPDGSIDLLWCEGAAYVLGFDTALRTWRPRMKVGGLAAVSELCWLVDPAAASEVARTFWEGAYPAMRTVGANARAAAATGWRVRETRTLPTAAWEAYYNPLSARIAALRPAAAPELAALLDALDQEIAVWREMGGAVYGYVFFLLEAGADGG